MFVQVTAKNVGGVFFETQCSVVAAWHFYVKWTDVCVHLWTSCELANISWFTSLWQTHCCNPLMKSLFLFLLPTNASVCLSVCLSVSVCPSLCVSVCLSVCVSCLCFKVWKPEPRNVISVVELQLEDIQVMLVYQGHQVKVKVTVAKRSDERNIRGWAGAHSLVMCVLSSQHACACNHSSLTSAGRCHTHRVIIPVIGSHIFA